MCANRYTVVHTQLLLFKKLKRQKYKKLSSDSVPFKTWQDQQKLALEELKKQHSTKEINRIKFENKIRDMEKQKILKYDIKIGT